MIPIMFGVGTPASRAPTPSPFQDDAVMTQPAAARPARILIADDNPQGAELLEAYLSGGDYEIATAADGEETLRRVKEFQPDVLLLDVMMPKISGFEVCKRLKANPETADIMVM